MTELTGQQETLLALLHRRAGWDEVTDTLGISRAAVHSGPLLALVESGLVGRKGDLPPGAVAGTNPIAEDAAVFAAFATTTLPRLTGQGWAEESAARVVERLSRIGVAPPPAPDERFTRQEWTGQTTRRVGWAGWVVQSVLSPHPSAAHWASAAPRARFVELWDDVGAADPVGWLRASRGDPRLAGCSPWFPVSDVRAKLPGLSQSAYAGLTMCAAWVLEARAVLDQDALESFDA